MLEHGQTWIYIIKHSVTCDAISTGAIPVDLPASDRIDRNCPAHGQNLDKYGMLVLAQIKHI